MKDRQIWYEVIFEQVKMRDVLTMYVSRVDKHKGRIPCPFHHGHDNNFSYNEDLFQCWVCGEQGNVISFVAKLFNITNNEAARKIDADFNLGVFGIKPKLSTRRKAERLERERKQNQLELDALNKQYNWLCSVRRYYVKYYSGFSMCAADIHTDRIDKKLDHIMEEIDARR